MTQPLQWALRELLWESGLGRQQEVRQGNHSDDHADQEEDGATKNNDGTDRAADHPGRALS